MSQVQIFVSRTALVEIRQYIKENQKIRAIKMLRSTGRILDPTEDTGFRSPGLREAKHAVDALYDRKHVANAEAVIVPAWQVNSLTVTGPLGEKIEVSLDELQMHFLTSLHSVGLDEVSRLMELVDFIRKWSGDTRPEDVERSDD